MALKIGIFFPGLGLSSQKETTLKYATRFANQLEQLDSVVQSKYVLKQEIVRYQEDDKLDSDVVTIYRTLGDKSEPVYKFYGFNYSPILTSKYENSSVFIRALLLVKLMIGFFPVALFKAFYLAAGFSYPRRFRLISFYSVFIMLLLALLGMSLLPSIVVALTEINEVSVAGKSLDWMGYFNKLSVISLSIFAIITSFIPGVRGQIDSLATQFVCAGYYFSYSERAQLIHGSLDFLIEYISEHEEADTKIHFHAYSFGNVILFDHIFPISTKPTERLSNKLEAVISIAFSYDFINVYYSNFYKNRDATMANGFSWLNIYSKVDALATNFRHDDNAGTSEYGIDGIGQLPENQQYEIANTNVSNVFNFITLYSLRAHQQYWDIDSTLGQSCHRGIVVYLKDEGMITFL